MLRSDDMPIRTNAGRLVWAIALGIGGVVSISGGVSTTEADDDSVQTQVDAVGIEFFERRIRPILIEHCLECHGEDPEAEGESRSLDRGRRARGWGFGAIRRSRGSRGESAPSRGHLRRQGVRDAAPGADARGSDRGPPPLDRNGRPDPDRERLVAPIESSRTRGAIPGARAASTGPIARWRSWIRPRSRTRRGAEPRSIDSFSIVSRPWTSSPRRRRIAERWLDAPTSI